MSVMTATANTPGITPGRPFTVDDLEAMPDDGRRYELIDGMLIVSPAPMLRHQKIVLKLAIALDASCPADLHVLPAPFAVQPSKTTELQPDVLVAREEDLTEKLLPVAPLLVVEVLSPSTAINDLNNKKAAYERLGVPSYWVIDPQQLTSSRSNLTPTATTSRTPRSRATIPSRPSTRFPYVSSQSNCSARSPGSHAPGQAEARSVAGRVRARWSRRH